MYLHINRNRWLRPGHRDASDNAIVRLTRADDTLRVHPDDVLPRWVDAGDVDAALYSVSVGRLPPTGDIQYQIRDSVDLRCLDDCPAHPGHTTMHAATRVLLRGGVLHAHHPEHGLITLGAHHTAVEAAQPCAALDARGDVLWVGDAFDVVWRAFAPQRSRHWRAV